MNFEKIKRETNYDVSYVDEVMTNFGYMCHSSVVLFKTPLEEFFPKFLDSPFCKGVEDGNPHFLVGYSGVEMAKEILGKHRKAGYYYTMGDIWTWIGRSIALVQWYTCREFKLILEMQPLSVWYQMYNAYHTMDESQLLDWAGGVFLCDKDSWYYQYMIHGMPDEPWD